MSFFIRKSELQRAIRFRCLSKGCKVTVSSILQMSLRRLRRDGAAESIRREEQLLNGKRVDCYNLSDNTGRQEDFLMSEPDNHKENVTQRLSPKVRCHDNVYNGGLENILHRFLEKKRKGKLWIQETLEPSPLFSGSILRIWWKHRCPTAGDALSGGSGGDTCLTFERAHRGARNRNKMSVFNQSFRIADEPKLFYSLYLSVVCLHIFHILPPWGPRAVSLQIQWIVDYNYIS